MSVTINASISSGLVQTADTSGTLQLQSDGTTQFTVASTGAYGQLKQSTAVASTSGTSISFTSIPSWVKRITVMLSAVSTGGTNPFKIQLSTGGTYTTTGYSSMCGSQNVGGSALGASTDTGGFICYQLPAASSAIYGQIIISNITSNTWVYSADLMKTTGTAVVTHSSGGIAMGGVVDGVRVIGAALNSGTPTDTFTAGSINILYEG